MPIHTYIPGLRLTLRATQRYITRYQATLSGFLSPEAYACLADILDAIASCLALLETPVPEE